MRFSSQDTLVIPRSGTYTLLIEGDRYATGTADYSFNVQPVGEPVTTAVNIGDTVSGYILVTGERDIYSFTVGSRSRLHFDSFTSDSSMTWTLEGPGGEIVSSRAFVQSDSFYINKPALDLRAGDYTITVD